MDNDIRSLIFQAIDQTISAPDFERLQEAIQNDDQIRREYLQAVDLCEALSEIATHQDQPSVSIPQPMRPATVWRLSNWQLLATAATILTLVGSTTFWLGQRNRVIQTAQEVAPAPTSPHSDESKLEGHATLRRAVGLQWPEGAIARHEGDVLPRGAFGFETGVAEIDFFCGATLIVEGPAELEIQSDWSVRVAHGRLRANVPPAARGFVVQAADSEVVDLGTEFAMEVDPDNASVAVIDGEVELRGGKLDGTHLVTGEAQSLTGQQMHTDLLKDLSTGADLSQLRQQADDQQFELWKTHSTNLQSDDRLIAYYPIAAGITGRSVNNAASTGTDRNGLMVGSVQATSGRFGPGSTGLEFDRPGARVRTRIEGEFNAYTFACWARIDSLEHRYNALFMADGYENGEPHWQIRDDGQLMFSVMIDDTQEIEHFSETDQKMVTQAGLHRVYYSPSIWDISKSGQWFHLVAVYDPANRRVQQYVNGKRISNDEIVSKFHITKLRIGSSEIGNWGQPFRKTPWFAVRNLNGTIDELAIFDAALKPTEIQSLYEQGRPVGY